MITNIHYQREERTMNSTSRIRRRVVALMFGGLFLAIWLTGCQSLAQRDVGKIVPDFNRVAIPSQGTSSHTLKTDDMAITYQCRRAGDKLKVWGSGKLNFEDLDELVFHLYFLDAQGRVISTHNFYSFADQEDFDVLKYNVPVFQRDLTIPAGAVAFALGYDGTTVQSHTMTGRSFSYYPFS
jgi:hypothetical protein